MDSTNRDSIDVAYVARLARIDLSEDELRSFQTQLQGIVGYVRKVQELDVSSVEPMSHVIPMNNVFRNDEVRDGLAHEAVLANAPAQRDGQFVVPRIME
ncbi:MAG: Asp-tRNA(Asn)/Glu-tRNA(Gln) amidotransferase subunit GatC [bacterium]